MADKRLQIISVRNGIYFTLEQTTKVKTENYPTQNTNPQTLAITGVPADWVVTKVVER